MMCYLLQAVVDYLKKNIMAADALYFGPYLENQIMMVRIINPVMKRNVIYKGTKLGCISVLSDWHSVHMFDNTAEKTKHEIIYSRDS